MFQQQLLTKANERRLGSNSGNKEVQRKKPLHTTEGADLTLT